MILGVLLVMNGDALSSVAGFPDAYNSVASVLGGAQTAFNWFICALIILTIISAGGVWQQGGVRIQAVAGLDGAAPLWFGKFSKQGTPLTMNILSAIIGSVFVVLVFLIAEGSLATFFAHHGLGDHLAHGDDVHLPDPGRDHAAQEVPGPSPAVPRARRPGLPVAVRHRRRGDHHHHDRSRCCGPACSTTLLGPALRHRLLVGRLPRRTSRP